MIKVPDINLTHQTNLVSLVRAFDFRVGIQGWSSARYLIFPFFPALNVDIATHMDYILAMINASANQRRAKGGER